MTKVKPAAARSADETLALAKMRIEQYGNTGIVALKAEKLYQKWMIRCQCNACKSYFWAPYVGIYNTKSCGCLHKVPFQHQKIRREELCIDDLWPEVVKAGREALSYEAHFHKPGSFE